MNEEAQAKIDKLYTNIWFWLKDETDEVKDKVMQMLGYRKISELSNAEVMELAVEKGLISFSDG